MSKKKKNHSDFMKIICGVCTRKFPTSDLRSISDDHLEKIKNHVYEDYDLSVMPHKFCKSCQKSINEIAVNGDKAGYKKPNVDYKSLRLPATMSTRQQDQGTCNCSYCDIGRLNGKEYLDHCENVRKGPGRSPVEENSNPPVETQKICSFCKGKNFHSSFVFVSFISWIFSGVGAGGKFV